MKRDSGRGAIRRRALEGTSLSSVLLKAALATAGIVAVCAPEAAAQCSGAGDVVCTGSNSLGIQAGDGSSFPTAHTLTVRDQTTPINPSLAPLLPIQDGVRMVRSDARTPGLITLDDTVQININTLAGQPPAFGVVARDTVNVQGAPSLTINSAADITLNSNFNAPRRADYFGEPWRIENAQFELDQFYAALPDLDVIQPGVVINIFDLFNPNQPAFVRLAAANCFLGDPSLYDRYLNLCVGFAPLIQDRVIFETDLNAAIARELATIDFYDNAPPPDLVLRAGGGDLRAAIYAQSTGVNWNPSGDVTINNSGNIDTSGDFALGILARTHTLHGEHVPTGSITVSNVGRIRTMGDSSAGIVAYSTSPFSDFPDPAGDITITGTGAISTEGQSAYGIYAGSFGGPSDHGGGDAPGGDGGVIEITYGGLISTLDVDAVGIWAESRGGLGGFGDSASDFRESYAGGFGGFGGMISVTVEAGGGVTTEGDRAHAIYAVSAAGDGGWGGEGYLDSWDPSRGGGGGNGGNVTITNWGVLSTHGDDAFGISASSLAGAGGFGGDDDGFFDPGRGAMGGPAGRGGNVTVTNAAGGLIETFGDGSIGMFAQSVGGLGGQGGRASSMFNPRGGVGGTAEHPRCQSFPFICPDGGAVTLANTGTIATHGDYAQAVFGQSIGGGGGLGGRSSGWFFVDGGDGGDAGAGGLVDITNSGAIATQGDYSVGLFAQSVGGGGGAGGDAFAGGNLAAVSLGGDGGAGGRGGIVNVTNESSGIIVTDGQRADGIFAQSVGGGGGTGGSAFSFAAGGGFAASVAIGGSGGDGGGGGELVTVENHGQIHAHGDFSNGIVAQSVGGGGGAGGSAYSFAASVGIEGSLAVSVGVGGSGAGGGDGGDVLVQNFGGVTTYDFSAFGVLAQSVGGGGGTGGSSTAHAISANLKKGAAVAVSVAVGGKGGAGGDGKHARVENEGTIVTLGDGSTGVFAQSVGGGGGIGGDASASTETISGGKSNDVKVDVSVGGSGGTAGDGGLVEVVNEGSIITLGYMANGITGQSVGGGGGIGGAGEQGNLFEDMGIPDMPELPEFEDEDDSQPERRRARDRYSNIQGQARDATRDSDSFGRSGKKSGKDDNGIGIGVGIGVGGSGGSAGHGGMVDIDNIGEIITGGRFAMGIFAQSVGGGGGEGAGGSADGSGDIGVGAGVGGSQGGSGNGGEVFVSNVGDITTLQEESFGIFAQSVGGGGGLAGVGAGAGEEKHNFSLSIGGDAAAGGNGMLVDVDQEGDVLTIGRAAMGVYAQSVGGGGGYGGSAEQDAFASVSLGGLGGLGGDGGVVDVDVAGRITTEGDYAHGLFAQSVGGGGGVGGGIATTTYVHTIDAFGGIDIDTGLTLGVGALGLSGNGGAAGNGGKVFVDTSGTITTLGESAHGIIAQSVAGGGGMGGSGGASLPLALAEAGSNGGVGVADTVSVTHYGSIRTFGENSVGIWTQSVDGADVGCTDIPLCPVLPRPVLDGRGKDITITLNNGEIIGGSGASGAGIFVSGGNANTITNRGGRISALSGNAIIATDGDDRIFNSGLIDGNVGLGGGMNAFVNQAGGLFQTREAIYLGAGNLFSNAGIISPYGEDVGETTLVGDFVQGANGILRVNLDPGGGSDLITVQGNASLGGVVAPIVGDIAELETGVFTTVLQATTLVDAGVTVDAGDTLVINYATRFQKNQFQIGISEISFDIDGLSEQESDLARHLQDLWERDGSHDFSDLLDALAFEEDAEAYAALLSNLHPYNAFSQGNYSISEAQGFLSGLMSCPEADGWTNPLREAECVWFRASYSKAEQEAAGGSPAHENNSARVQGGQQFGLGEGWFAGFAAGYQANTFAQDNGASARSDGFHLGGVLKREAGPLLLAAAADAGYAMVDRNRSTGFPTIVTAESSSDTAQVSARLRAAYTAELTNGFYLKPAVDIDGYFIRANGFTETGADALGLTVADAGETLGAGTVSLEAGFVSKVGDTLLHPYIEAGYTRLSADSLDLLARFQGAPADASDFVISTAIPEELASGRIGLEALMPYGSLRIEYEHREGDGYLNRSVSAKVRFAF